MSFTYSGNSFNSNSPRSGFIRTFLGMVVIAVFAGVLGYQVATEGYRLNISAAGISWNKTGVTATQRGLDLTEFWRVLGLIEDNYINLGEVDNKTLVDGAIKGMVDALGDPYSYYLTTDETDSFQEGLDGVYEGIGVQLGYRDDNLIVIAPLSGGPAEQVGVKSGDIILAVEGESVASLNLGEVVQRVRGEEGSSVKVTFARQKTDGGLEPLELTIPRAKINAPNILVTHEDGIAIISILRFGTDIVSEWKNIVVEENLAQAAGILIDVRNNPGGYLNGAAEIASTFTPKGVMVSQEYSDGKRDDFTSNKEGALLGKPIVVLMNESSASASEILAGALKVSAGATLVGQKSFGKNTVQQAYQLDKGTSVHITAAHWLLPNGERIPDDGMVPDVVVEGNNGNDDQKDKAIEVLKEKM